MRRKVIIDADVGFDDAWALIMMLQAEKMFGTVEVLGITCVNGNTSVSNAATNTLRVLEMLNRTDIKVYEGAHRGGILGKYERPELPFHGKDGLCDVFTDPINTTMKIESKHAVNALVDLVNEFPHEVTLICLGPLTNIALALNLDSDFTDKVKDVFIMGGNYRGIGNITKCAEFNFAADAEAASIVLNSFDKKIISILPWEACIVPDSTITMEWRKNVLGILDSPIAQFMNKVEYNQPYQRTDYWMLCDQQCVAVFLCGDQIIERSITCNATVVTGDDITRGMVLIDHLQDRSLSRSNVTIVQKLNEEKLKKLMLWCTLPSSVPDITDIIQTNMQCEGETTSEIAETSRWNFWK